MINLFRLVGLLLFVALFSCKENSNDKVIVPSLASYLAADELQVFESAAKSGDALACYRLSAYYFHYDKTKYEYWLKKGTVFYDEERGRKK